MKIVETRILISKGQFSKSKKLKEIHAQIEEAILEVHWPPNTGAFILHDQPGKARNAGSGVTPIKNACMKFLKSKGWSLEKPLEITSSTKPGPMDAVYPITKKSFCLEWETGNISSTHRALNKMAIGLLKNVLVGGVLVLPTKKMSRYLTDRVGNFEEIEPYFHLWESLVVEEGYLAVIAVEHDGVSKDVPRIPKGTDGRALL